MASAAEQLAANLNFQAFAKASELHKRLLFTAGALIIYRLGTYIPLPGVDPLAFEQAFNQFSGGALGIFNAFSGGAIERMAIFALNVMPYITASIIMQIMAVSIPKLEQLKKEGEAGRKQINQYTRYLTVFLALFQAYSIVVGLEAGGLVVDPGWFYRVSGTLTLVGGTMFLMWLGEQITARGVGNGVSLIIFAGIVAEFPRALFQLLESGRTGAIAPMLVLAIVALAIGLVLFIVFMERSQRRLLIQYPKRQVGNRMFGGDTSFLPLKLNTAGVIPPILASSLLVMPATIGAFSAAGTGPEWWQTAQALLGRGQPVYMLLYGGMIVFFCYLYTSIVFNPEETAENLRKYGGFLPGIRPGQRTAEYIDYVLTRLTTIGAAYITFVCLLPEWLISQYQIPFYIGGTSILIVVSVTMDTVTQIQSHLLAHQYEGLIKKSRLRGRTR